MSKSGSSIRVKLEKRVKTGLGLCIKPENGKVVVTSLLKGGIAEESGLVIVGDAISRINDIDITNLPYQSALEILDAIPAGVPVILLISCLPSQTTFLQTTFTDSGQPFTIRITQPVTNGTVVLDENKNVPRINQQQHANGGLAIPKDDGTGAPNQNEAKDKLIIKKTDALKLDNALPEDSERKNLVERRVSQCPVAPKKYQKLRYLLDPDKTYTDTLHQKAFQDTGCSSQRCTGSILEPVPPRPPGTARPLEELIKQARDFIDQYYTSIKRFESPSHTKRLSEVLESINSTGTYHLTSPELTFGAKTAWRNASRCIGRIQWSKLQVFDARHICSARGMFDAIVNHIKYATNKGMIRSALTIFPPRTDGNHDYRVWNGQLISYAAYEQEDGSIKGDKAHLEFTQLCEKLGWKGSGGEFDLLPLVLQANGQDPEVFELSSDLVLEVHLKHPDHPWFEELGLKWYAVPAVANMMLDVGGLEFTAVPFNGWYMGTEIGARDLCDVTRYDKAETVAQKMGLDTGMSASLWKDQVLVTVNIAVLHSYQASGVSITDHHSAAESFLKHYDNEMKARGGCPADWVWVVPPISGSLNPVFHLEMLNYKLKPSYEYQADPWTHHVWKKDKISERAGSVKRQRPKITFKELARAVRLTAKLMSTALAKRVKCTILYATETGRSEGYAKTLGDLFGNAFDVKLHCMSDYNCLELEHETLVLVVTSTFGNGDPPDNGTEFAKMLYEMVPEEKQKRTMKSVKHLTLTDRTESSSEIKVTQQQTRTDKFSHSTSLEGPLDEGPLENVRFSVFALGSTAYPNFCSFGRYLDRLLGDLGGERIHPRGEGDELCGQEQSFKQWAQQVFKVACDTFCLGEDVNMEAAKESLTTTDRSWAPGKLRLTPVEDEKEPELNNGLSKVHNKTVLLSRLLNRKNLQASTSERQTILVKLDTEKHGDQLLYEPGGHVAVFPANDTRVVARVIKRLSGAPPKDQVVKIEWLKEKSTPLGPMRVWEADKRLPDTSIQRAFSNYLDLRSTPSQALLEQLAVMAENEQERDNLNTLAKNANLYENWKYEQDPNLAEVLEEFSSVRVSATLLLSQLPLLQPRYYSISSCPDMYPGQLHMTVAVVKYETQNGSVHQGVCSSWLNETEPGEEIPCLVRSAPSFRMPTSTSVPIIMVGPGTGIAPFRSFWQKRMMDLEDNGSCNYGSMVLFFGCRQESMDFIYRRELEEAKNNQALDEYHVALSREPDKPKTYVQDLLTSQGQHIASKVLNQGAHFYVCGDVTMAQNVGDTLENVLEKHGGLSDQAAGEYVLQMKEERRYHEDIFGVTLKTSKVLGKAFDESKVKRDNWMKPLKGVLGRALTIS